MCVNVHITDNYGISMAKMRMKIKQTAAGSRARTATGLRSKLPSEDHRKLPSVIKARNILKQDF
jgi:hypothetical protein